MESILITSKVFNIASTIGTDIIIKSLTVTTRSVGSLISTIYSYDEPSIIQIKNKLIDIDLEYMVNIIEEVVKDCNKLDKNNIPISITKAIHGVTEILDKIHDELTSINQSIIDHEKKYFHKWRSFNCKYNIQSIKKHKIILDSRYNILIDLLKINL